MYSPGVEDLNYNWQIDTLTFKSDVLDEYLVQKWV